MSSNGKVTLLVHTRQSRHRIQQLIDTTAWIPHRIAIDMQSDDGTSEHLAEAGFEILSIEPKLFYDEMRNDYLSIPKTPWTLVMDSDEYLADDAREQIEQLMDTAEAEIVGYRIPRHNYLLGKKMQGSGWYPDHQLRLFRTNRVYYRPGHHLPPLPRDTESIVRTLETPSNLHIHHNNYPTISEMLSRQLHYATTDVYDPNPESFDFDDYMLSAIREFNKRYELQEDGQLSYLTGMIMYWNEINRGFIHWERTGYRGRLTKHLPNQVFLSGEFGLLKAEIDRLNEELATRDRAEIDGLHKLYQSSRSWRLTSPLRGFTRFLKRILGHVQ